MKDKINELVFMGKKRNLFTTSAIIADGTGNKHHAVRELTKRYRADFEELGTLLISNEESIGGRPKEVFLLNEEQAAFLMTLLRNSKTVVEFKKELVRQFYAIRERLTELGSPRWQETRLAGKAVRRMETDEIKAFVAYAQSQGSKHAEKYYCLFTKLANKAVGLDPEGRDEATILQLNILSQIEHITGRVITECMQSSEPYRQIYEKCKDRIEQFTDIAYITPKLLGARA